MPYINDVLKSRRAGTLNTDGLFSKSEIKNRCVCLRTKDIFGITCGNNIEINSILLGS